MHPPATTPPVPVLRVLAAVLALCTVLGVWLGARTTAFAASAPSYPGEAVGNDISFPQCGHDFPDGAAFGIVGVTGGRAFTGNPCLQSEYAWARGADAPASVYFNINYAQPGYPSFAAHALQGPAGSCARVQNACTAYNYGWNAATDAVDRAGDAHVGAGMWWLDVETANSWADPPDRQLNAQVIQAALDLLRWRGLSAGVYSINEMWARIAGTYRPGVPVWYAETDPAGGRPSAPHYCDPRYGFTGGAVWLVQWSPRVAHDSACRGNAAPPQPAPPPAGCLPKPIPLCLLTPALPPAPRSHGAP